MPKRSCPILVATLALLLPLAACGPEGGELAAPPVLVDYTTGDPANTMDGQLGMKADAEATVTGGLGFEGPAEIACGPRGDAFELRLTPQGARSPILTLRTVYGKHGHGSGHGKDHGEGHGTEHDGDHGAAPGDGDHGSGTAHRETSRTAGHGAGDHAVDHGAGHLESVPQAPEAAVHLARIQDGQLSQASGTGRVEMRAATHAAGRHAVSGTFTIDVAGSSLEGDFRNCYYFTG